MYENIESLLYVEDDDIVRENLESFFKRNVKSVYFAANGEEGLALYYEHKPDVIITDIAMPKLNGIQLAKKVREQKENTQIIITTSFSDNEYLLEAVNLQLVRYILKPLDLDKLTSALHQCDEALKTTKTNKKFFSKTAFYNVDTKELEIEKNVITLTQKERELLELLIQNAPVPLSYDDIFANLYEKDVSVNAVKTLVKTLRRKLPEGAIENIYGMGYKVNLEIE